ncbi:hypothetical protein R5R35_013367 [Gryllus longicercus]|uniref:Uncharacterized protein n=1 Tax=Gryllus longicercus TaxID=2509291 RepID=A0AAN9WC88_9ORTH
MDGHDIVFESVVKVEKVKEEPAEFFEEANPIDIHKTSTLKSVIKKEEDEELEPLVTVFLKSSEVTKEEVEEECEMQNAPEQALQTNRSQKQEVVSEGDDMNATIARKAFREEKI